MVQQTVEMVRHVAGAARTLGKEFAPHTPPTPEPARVPNPDDDFPVIVKDLGPMRLAAVKATQEVLTDPTSMALYNADKIKDGVKSFAKELREMVRERSQDQSKLIEEQTKLEEAKERARKRQLEDLREAAAIQERLLTLQARARGAEPAPQPAQHQHTHAVPAPQQQPAPQPQPAPAPPPAAAAPAPPTKPWSPPEPPPGWQQRHPRWGPPVNVPVVEAEGVATPAAPPPSEPRDPPQS
jgi:hypothetical protein